MGWRKRRRRDGRASDADGRAPDGVGASGEGDDGRADLAEQLFERGLWWGLDDATARAQRDAVAGGAHPWGTEFAVLLHCDGEDMAEGSVESFLCDEVAPAVVEHGVELDIATILRPASGSYVVSVNGDQVPLYGPGDWESMDESNPWYASSVRPLGAVNQLLDAADAPVRWHLLYPGAHDGLALLIPSAAVDLLRERKVLRQRDDPVRC